MLDDGSAASAATAGAGCVSASLLVAVTTELPAVALAAFVAPAPSDPLGVFDASLEAALPAVWAAFSSSATSVGGTSASGRLTSATRDAKDGMLAAILIDQPDRLHALRQFGDLGVVLRFFLADLLSDLGILLQRGTGASGSRRCPFAGTASNT